MLKIASWIDRRVPAARTAANDEPYSTTRRSPRWYQTRCGTSSMSGCAPVAIEVRHTGVTEGNVVVPRRYVPASWRCSSAGRRRSSNPRSSIAGVRPSMTARTRPLVLGKNSQPRVPRRCAAAESYTGERSAGREQIADRGDEGKRRGRERGQEPRRRRQPAQSEPRDGRNRDEGDKPPPREPEERDHGRDGHESQRRGPECRPARLAPDDAVGDAEPE